MTNLTEGFPAYTHDGLDFPDTPHDPNPERFMSPEAQAEFRQTTARQKALIEAWQGVPEPVRLRSIRRWFRRRS
jgi:hypothetical protein